MQEEAFRPVRVKVLKPCFYGDTSYEAGDEADIPENIAIDDERLAVWTFDPAALTNRGRLYRSAIHRPPIAGAPRPQY
jgi:hypothetical protein